MTEPVSSAAKSADDDSSRHNHSGSVKPAVLFVPEAVSHSELPPLYGSAGGAGSSLTTPRTPSGTDHDFVVLADGLSDLSSTGGSEELALPNLSAERDVIIGMRTADPTTFDRLLAMTDPILSPAAVLKHRAAAAAAGGNGGGSAFGFTAAPLSSSGGGSGNGSGANTPPHSNHHRRTSSGVTSAAVASVLQTPPASQPGGSAAASVISPFTYAQQQQQMQAGTGTAAAASSAAASGVAVAGAAVDIDQLTALRVRLAMHDADRAVLEDELETSTGTATELRRRYTLLNTRTAAVMQHNYSLQQMNASYSAQITELRSHSEALTAALSALSVQRRGSGSGTSSTAASSASTHSPSVDAALAVAASTAQTLQMRSKIDEHEMAALKLKYAQAVAMSERAHELERKLNESKANEAQHKAELAALLKTQLKYAETQAQLDELELKAGELRELLAASRTECTTTRAELATVKHQNGFLTRAVDALTGVLASHGIHVQVTMPQVMSSPTAASPATPATASASSGTNADGSPIVSIADGTSSGLFPPATRGPLSRSMSFSSASGGGLPGAGSGAGGGGAGPSGSTSGGFGDYISSFFGGSSSAATKAKPAASGQGPVRSPQSGGAGGGGGSSGVVGHPPIRIQHTPTYAASPSQLMTPVRARSGSVSTTSLHQLHTPPPHTPPPTAAAGVGAGAGAGASTNNQTPNKLSAPSPSPNASPQTPAAQRIPPPPPSTPATPAPANGAAAAVAATTSPTPSLRFTGGRIVLTQQSNSTIALRANVAPGTGSGTAAPQQVIPIA